MDKIIDLNTYTTEMRKSLIDKIYFMDKLDNSINTIIDYGCADGMLIDFLSNIFPEFKFIGYDISPQMIEAAKDRCAAKPNVFFTSDFPADFDPATTSVNLSSLIHEVYSYGTTESIEEFWRRINCSGFKYITIRDMCLDQSAHRMSQKEDILKVKWFCSKQQIDEFEAEHGSLSDNYNLIHFLMKYRYKANWEREVKENYLPLTVEELISRFSPFYELIYFDHYTLPFLVRKVKEDMNITLKDYTHIKMILRRQ